VASMLSSFSFSAMLQFAAIVIKQCNFPSTDWPRLIYSLQHYAN
jgi:hypothetical protein